MIRLTWGEKLSPHIASMIVARPAFGQRLALATTRVVHGIACIVYGALEDNRDLIEVADEIERHDVRDLLVHAVPNPHPRFFGMLDRFGPAAREIDAYRRLNTALHGPTAEAVFEASELNVSLLRVLESLVQDPVLWAARQAIGPSEDGAKSLMTALAFLRPHGLASDIESLPAGSGWRAILRRLKTDLGRARAPDPPFRAPEGWRRIETVAELWRVGTQMQNCVSSLRAGGEEHMGQLMTGTTVFLVRDGPPMILAAIENVGPALWLVGEMATMGERLHFLELREEFGAALAATMADVGIKLLTEQPFRAMASIAFRAGRKRLDVDLDDDIEDAA